MTRRKPPRAFMLIDVLAALVLLTAFALIAAPLFSETMHVIERAPAAQDAMTRFESVSQTLREDAWSARSFTTIAPNTIQIETPSEPSIQWQIDSTGDIERLQGTDQRRWTFVGTNAVLEIAGPCIVLRSTSPKADNNGQIRCPSLLQITSTPAETK
jgi:type II secretory pathway pseudopilin PulG